MLCYDIAVQNFRTFSIVVVEWQVNFGFKWPFCTNQGQYMCSNYPWPLLWQRAFNRWYWPNYPVSTRSRQGVTGVCLGSAWSRM